MQMRLYKIANIKTLGLGVLLLTLLFASSAYAREIKYKNTEVNIFVSPGEPTQVSFPGKIQGGFKKNQSALHLDRKDEDLIVFASEGLSERGEAIIVRLKDGRSYSIRIKLAEDDMTRDDVVDVVDERKSFVSEEDELKAYEERPFGYAPASTVTGLMRNMVLVSEFGKSSITGYQISERYKGETVLSDGAILARIDKIFIGPKYWGYVIDTSNMLNQSQRLNPASFRIDGTRAISCSNWELAPRPLNVEQQIAGKDKSKVYVITKARKF